jgi:hypothetical protein
MIGGKNRIKRLLNKKDTFQGTINGIEGIWQVQRKVSARVVVIKPRGNLV